MASKHPNFQCHSAAATVTALAYMFHGDFLSRALGVSLQRRTKHKRWRVYIHKQKTLTQICQDLIGRRDPRNVVFAYGMGRFNSSSRGYKPAPANQKWVTNRLTKGLHAKVININEFNTSQVCSGCFASRKLCAVGSNRDPFPGPTGFHPKKPLRAKMYNLSHDLEQRCERIKKYGLSGALQGLWCGPTCVVQQSTG